MNVSTKQFAKKLLCIYVWYKQKLQAVMSARRDRHGRLGGVLHPSVQEEGKVEGLHSAVCAEISCQDYS